jgi:hypothetical protein
MYAIVKNHKAVYAWSGDTPGVARAYLELAGGFEEIDSNTSDASSRILSMGDGVYLVSNIPDWVDMASGRDIREFDPATWRLLPITKLIELGYKKLAPYEKLVDGEVVLKTHMEQMRDGVIELPYGMKVIPDPSAQDGLGLDKMTIAEMVAAGQLTQAEADAATLAEVADKRSDLLNAAQWRIDRYRDQVDAGDTPNDTKDTYKALLKYKQALRDISTQEGYPYSVVWPEVVS